MIDMAELARFARLGADAIVCEFDRICCDSGIDPPRAVREQVAADMDRYLRATTSAMSAEVIAALKMMSDAEVRIVVLRTFDVRRSMRLGEGAS